MMKTLQEIKEETMSTEELLNDYVSYHFMEGNITDYQRIKMQEAVKDYLKQIDSIEKAKSNKECKHYFNYNFPSIPNKRICSHCKVRQQLDLKSLKWTLTFTDSRTDNELIKAWYGQIYCENR